MDASSFAFYRSTVARTPAQASCGHDIKPGDTIGHNPRVRRTKCANCWRTWQQENAEADAYEFGLLD